VWLKWRAHVENTSSVHCVARYSEIKLLQLRHFSGVVATLQLASGNDRMSL